MRRGLIADIHGNLAALEAVLGELGREEVDEIICLGDVAVGPQPVETLDRVRELDCPVVMGNWDAYFVSGFPPKDDEVSEKLVDMGEWWADKLSDDHREYIRSFEQVLEGPGFIAFHGSPRSYEDFIFSTTPDEELDEMLDGARAPLMIAGHTHFAMLRHYPEALIVNPGSVGLPFAKQEPVMHIQPWAEYAIVHSEDGRRLSVDLRRTSYDVDGFIELIRESGMPHSEWWASLWLKGGPGET
jgi:putative phosphoesterase